MSGLQAAACRLSALAAALWVGARLRAIRARHHPAKQLFRRGEGAGRHESAIDRLSTRGYLAGGEMLPVNRPTWQAMRLSRNAQLGSPGAGRIPRALRRQRCRSAELAGHAWSATCRCRAGGPMMTGHAPHQIGLDADIWLTPMPSREFYPAGARGHLRHDDRAQGPARRRSSGCGRPRLSR